MRISRYCILLVVMLLGASVAYPQEKRTEILVDFRADSTSIDTLYGSNPERIPSLISFLRRVQADSTTRIVRVTFRGSSSPEGSYEWNRRLANGRLRALEKLVRSKVEIPDSVVAYDDSHIPWDYLAEQVSASDIPHKDEILDIIGTGPQIVDYYADRTIDYRVLRLKALRGGTPWRGMLRRWFGPMRNACAVFVTFSRQPSVIVPEPVAGEAAVLADSVKTVRPATAVTDTVPAPAAVVEEWSRKLYVKTNALGWGFAVANAAVETDLCRRWSFHLPVYYSAWNYFTSAVKFRTLAFQPELRYWFSGDRPCNDGFFAGAHFGIAWYNVATDGEYRIQDHNGRAPALGGGLAVGYRLPVSRDNRWKVELSVGAGAYRLHYDKFRNRHDGLLVTTEKKTYVGIDQASVSFTYTFDLKKKGGAR